MYKPGIIKMIFLGFWSIFLPKVTSLVGTPLISWNVRSIFVFCYRVQTSKLWRFCLHYGFFLFGSFETSLTQPYMNTEIFHLMFWESHGVILVIDLGIFQWDAFLVSSKWATYLVLLALKAKRKVISNSQAGTIG